MDDKTLRNLEDMLEDAIKKVTKQNDMSAADLDNLLKAFCLMDKCEEKMSCMPNAMNYGTNGYSGNWHEPSYNPYAHYPDQTYAMGRSRSPVTGRYLSHGDEEDYSGHSIDDKMIMALENQMDKAKSEYERQRITEQIQKIRNNK